MTASRLGLGQYTHPVDDVHDACVLCRRLLDHQQPSSLGMGGQGSDNNKKRCLQLTNHKVI